MEIPTTKIPKGYILLARKLLDSEIWTNKPLWWLKVWIYILLKVNYEDTKRFKRGQGFFSAKSIKNGCMLYSNRVKTKGIYRVLAWLRREEQIEVSHETRGMIISVCNYGEYQIFVNYTRESQENHKRIIRESQENRIDTLYIKERKKERRKKNININTLCLKEWKIYIQNSLQNLLSDSEWIKKMEEDYPTVNIKRTTEKVFESYFSTEDCYKKRKGNSECNWKNAMNWQLGPKGANRVFKSNGHKPKYLTKEEFCRVD